MKSVVTYSSKQGLLNEYKKRIGADVQEEDIPADLFAEGDSLQTIQSVIDAIAQGSYEVYGMEADDELPARLQATKPDLVFNIAEGLWGDCRESYVPMICERLGLPYSGSDPLTLAICLNKARAKEILSYHHIPTPSFSIVTPENNFSAENFTYPAIIKPLAEGSSKGIFNDSVVYSPAEARYRIKSKMQNYRQSMLIEEFLSGAEFTVAMWGNQEQIEVLPIVAINYQQLPPAAHPIYSYEAKWIWDTPDKPLDIFQCPAQIASDLRQQIEHTARLAYQLLNVRDWCRIDVRLDERGIPNVLELNPLPGILPDPKENSCFPKAARTAGYNYPAMLQKVVHIALHRNGLQL
jgi:D-alanine-D-alanine ligase